MGRGAYHHGDLRRALLKAARCLVERDGPGGTSLRAIAREAGVSAAAPYHHFADRDAILAAVAEEGFGELAEAMAQRARRVQTGRALQRLQAAGVAYVGFAVKNPEVFRVMFGGLLGDRSAYPALQQRAAETFEVLAQLLGEAGKPSAGRALPRASLAAWSTVHGLANLLIDGRLGGPPTERRAAQAARDVTEILGMGLRTLADAGAPERS